MTGRAAHKQYRPRPTLIQAGLVGGLALALFAASACSGKAVAPKADAATTARRQSADTTSEPTTSTSTTTTSTTTTVPPTTTTEAPPQPVVYDGSGANVVELDKSRIQTGLLYVRGNAGGRFFAVKGLDDSGQETDLFVNTTEVYEGVRPFDFTTDTVTVRLEIEAEGPWHIELRPLVGAHTAAVPGTTSGHGDEVLLLINTSSPDVLHVVGNKKGSFFAVKSYGSASELLVNTTDPYDGRVVVPKASATFVEVQSEDDWTLTFE